MTEGFHRIEWLTGLEAVMELAEHLVEQMPQGCRVSISVCWALLVVPAGGAVLGCGGECPDPAGGEAVVLAPAVGDGDRLAGRAGDRRESGHR
ncbi:hypothetical protein GZH49_40240 [Nocardia terpenica]|uniref:hypothetical protein n=1 Tax=Nocardia terpenica TaxID=455432 RepID=UPI002FDF2B0F